MKKIYKFFIKMYFCIKSIFNPRRPKKILDKMSLSMYDFSRELNSMNYAHDPLHGLVDYVSNPDTFFDNKKYGRDCDDWARMWSWWLTYNGYEAAEYCVTNPKNIVTLFNKMHMVTIGHKDDKWYLMNYHPYGPFKSEESALEFLTKFTSYKDDILYVKTPTKFSKG